MGLFDFLKKKADKAVQRDQVKFSVNEECHKDCISPLDAIVSAWKELNADIIAPFLSDSIKYNSAWVSDTIVGKEKYLDYLRHKFDAIRNSEDVPVIDLVEESGELRPRISQKSIDVDSILDLVQEENKIVRLLMRPAIKLTIVDDDEWVKYNEAYNNALPLALQIAGKAIQDYIESKGFNPPEFSWIQTNLVHPYFQHLCFRYRTEVYSILIGIIGFQSADGKDDDGIIISKHDLDNLLAESKKNNLIPCFAPVAVRAKLPLSNYLNLFRADTGEIVTLNARNECEQVPMSGWEINSMGVQFVLQHLQQKGYRVNSYCDLVGFEPQIWFDDNGKASYVIIRSNPIGKRKEKFRINKKLLSQLKEFEGYFADVQFASSSPILKDENGKIVPLSKRDTDGDVWMWRGDGFYCNFTGLQKIEDAISANTFIEVTDDDVFGIQ